MGLYKNRRSILPMLIIFILSVLIQIQDVGVANAFWKKGMNPGVKLRLEQKDLEKFKISLIKFLPEFLDSGFFPKEAKYAIGFPWIDELKYHFDWTEITYSKSDLKPEDIELLIVKKDDDMLLKVTFDALKSWKVKAKQTVDTWIPEWMDGEVELHISPAFTCHFNTEFDLDKHGYLNLDIENVYIDFADSFVKHEQEFADFVGNLVMNQVFRAIESTSYFIGHTMLGDYLGPIISKYLDKYHIPLVLESPLPGQGTSAEFSFDYRPVADPFIGNGWIEFDMLGEMMFKSHKDNKFQDCHMNPLPMEYLPDKKVWSQLAVSEAAADCFAKAVASSDIGRVELTKQKLNDMFRMDNFELSSSSLARYIPVFYDKLGRGVEMKIDLSFKDIAVNFGRYATDVTFDYTVCVDFRELNPNLAHGGKRLLYDEIKMLTGAQVKVENDNLTLVVENHKINYDRTNHKLAPVDDKLGMTEYQYRKFLSTFGYSMSELRRWMNSEVLNVGYHFPYNTDQIDTRFSFKEDVMYVFLEFEEDVVQIYTDEKAKAKEREKQKNGPDAIVNDAEKK